MSEADRQVEALYREHGHRVLAYLVRRTCCPEDAADVMGEVMVTTWRRREDLPASPSDVLWLFAVARHTLANHRRATGRREQVTQRLAATVSEVAADHGAAADARIDVGCALERLRPTDREILGVSAEPAPDPGAPALRSVR